MALTVARLVQWKFDDDAAVFHLAASSRRGGRASSRKKKNGGKQNGNGTHTHSSTHPQGGTDGDGAATARFHFNGAAAFTFLHAKERVWLLCRPLRGLRNEMVSLNELPCVCVLRESSLFIVRFCWAINVFSFLFYFFPLPWLKLKIWKEKQNRAEQWR